MWVRRPKGWNTLGMNSPVTLMVLLWYHRVSLTFVHKNTLKDIYTIIPISLYLNWIDSSTHRNTHTHWKTIKPFNCLWNTTAWYGQNGFCDYIDACCICETPCNTLTHTEVTRITTCITLLSFTLNFTVNWCCKTPKVPRQEHLMIRMFNNRIFCAALTSPTRHILIHETFVYSLFSGVRKLVLPAAVVGFLNARVWPQHLNGTDVGLVKRRHLLNVYLLHHHGVGL